MGPAPLKAVKLYGNTAYTKEGGAEKALLASYDTCFVISEANYMEVDNNGSPVTAESITLTSLPNLESYTEVVSGDPKTNIKVIQNITSDYRPVADPNANSFSINPSLYTANILHKDNRLSTIKIIIKPTDVNNNIDMSIFFFSDASGQADFNLSGFMTDYTSKQLGDSFININESIVLSSNEVTIKQYTFDSNDIDFSKSNYIKFVVTSKYPNKDNLIVGDATAYLTTPSDTIMINVKPVIKIGETIKAKISFKNPYSYKLSNVKLIVTIPHMSTNKYNINIEQVDSKQTVTKEIDLKLNDDVNQKLKNTIIQVKIKCDEIHKTFNAAKNILFRK